MLSTIPGEDSLKYEFAKRLLNAMFNATVEYMVKPDRDPAVPRYKSTNRLLTSYMEND